MSIENDVNESGPIHILFCPFSERCILPQKAEICKFPNYKQCPEYTMKLAKLKHEFQPFH